MTSKHLRVGHGLLAALVAAALAVQVGLTLADEDATMVRLVSFFTIQSNVAVAVMSAGVAWRPELARTWAAGRLVALVLITVTGVVYVALLRGQDLPGVGGITNIVFHYVAPAACVALWAADRPRGAARLRHLLYLAVFLAMWSTWTLVHGGVTGWYPYPFIDAAALGYPRMLLNAAGIVLVMVAVGLGYLRVDRSRLEA